MTLEYRLQSAENEIMPRPAQLRAKRLADIVFSACILLVTSPLLLIAGLAIRLTTRGPALYRANRMGQYGETFAMLKFRTMVMDADRIGPAVTAGGDPRITPLGHFLRRTKMDEIPQFWNVLVGDMSIVGPRPNDPQLVAEYTREEWQILNVPQGITDYSSLWFRQQEQLHAGAEDVMSDYRERVAPIKGRLAIYYAAHPSLLADWRIFWATFLAVIFRIDPAWVFPKEEPVSPTLSKSLADRATSR